MRFELNYIDIDKKKKSLWDMNHLIKENNNSKKKYFWKTFIFIPHFTFF